MLRNLLGRPSALQQVITANNHRNKKGSTALTKALNTGNVAYAEKLIDDPTTDLNLADDNGFAPIHYAVSQPELLKKLIAKRANVHAQTKFGETPLMIAVATNQLPSVIELIKYQVNIQTPLTSDAYRLGYNVRKGDTPLHAAFRANELNPDLIATLLRAGADINTANSHEGYRTPFHLFLSHKDAAKLPQDLVNLIMHRANYSHTLKGSNPTLLHCAARNPGMTTKLFSLLVNKLMDAGVLSKTDTAVNFGYLLTRNDVGKTSLDIAVIGRNMGVINVLNEIPSPLLKSDIGEEALKIALLNKDAAIMLQLLNLGVNPLVHVTLPKQSFSLSSFSSASSEDEYEKSHLLQEGDTPLHFAVKTEDEELAAACLRKPETVNAPNAYGKSPAFTALNSLSHEMAHAMRKVQSNIFREFPVKGENRMVTMKMTAASHGFKSDIDLDNFFNDPNYKLSDEQKLIRDKKLKKWNKEPTVSVGKFSFLKTPSSGMAVLAVKTAESDVSSAPKLN